MDPEAGLMLFNFMDFNHCPQGKIIVEDITRTMGHQLMALGHKVRWSNEFLVTGTGGYNFILESFADDPATIDRMRDARRAADAHFIIVATEEPTPNGFNHGLEPAMIDRQNAFPAAANLCDGILHLMPGEHVNAWYRQHAPAAYAELGYAPSLHWGQGEEPEYDFGFYGKMTWRRDQMLGQLEARGTRVLRLTSLDVPLDERNMMMRKAKVIVQIRGNEEWQQVSSTRCSSALHMGRPVVAEPHADPKAWGDVVLFSRTVEAFYDDALHAARHWRALHQAQMAEFILRFSPQTCIGEPLQKIGVL